MGWGMIPISKLETLDIDGSTSVVPAAVMTYADIQGFLKLDGSADQTLVENLISVATKKVEESLCRKLITQVWSIYFDCFPSKAKEDTWWDGSREGAIGDLYSPIRYIDLPFGPCQSVAFLKTFDDDGTAYTFDSTNYNVDTVSHRPRLALKNGATWPTTLLRSVNGIQIRGTFGYGAAATIPPDLLHAIRLFVAKLYENRGDNKDGEGAFTIPSTAMALLEPYKFWKLK